MTETSTQRPLHVCIPRNTLYWALKVVGHQIYSIKIRLVFHSGKLNMSGEELYMEVKSGHWDPFLHQRKQRFGPQVVFCG